MIKLLNNVMRVKVKFFSENADFLKDDKLSCELFTLG